jgi:hypothetical protein
MSRILKLILLAAFAVPAAAVVNRVAGTRVGGLFG